MKDGTFCVCFYRWNRSDEFMAAWRAAGLRPVGHMANERPGPALDELLKRQGWQLAPRT